MNYFELIVEIDGQRKSLDTFQDSPVSLNYNIADLQDLSSRDGGYSKTIRLPDTKRNRKTFNNIADLNVNSTTFNPNKKVKAWVFQDSIPVFEGYMQLRAIKKTGATTEGYEGGAEYEVVIFTDNITLFQVLGDSELTALDWSDLDHTLTKSTVEASWTASNSGYYYPLIDYGANYNIQDLDGTTDEHTLREIYPATSVKTIVDRIFTQNGYTYESEFFNERMFTNLYVPFNRPSLKRDLNDTTNRFSVGLLTAPVIVTDNDIYVQPDAYESLPGVYTSVLSLTKFDPFIIPFNNENTPFGDPSNIFNVGLNAVQANGTEPVQRFVCDFDILFAFETIYELFDPQGGQRATSICFKRSNNPLTGQVVTGGTIIPVNGSLDRLGFVPSDILGVQVEGKRVIGRIATDFLDGSTVVKRPLAVGELAWVEVTFGTTNQSLRAEIGDANLSLSVGAHPLFGPDPVQISALGLTNRTRLPLNTSYALIFTGTRFFNVLSEDIQPGELIEYKWAIPQKIKQRDFLLSVIRMFNLYFEPVKGYTNRFRIEPRDRFLLNGNFKDWTSKISNADEATFKILGESQPKRVIYTYAEDQDFYNVDYKSKTQDVYGEFDLINDNDFSTGDKKIELIFAPTPIVPVTGSNEILIPKIGKINNGIFGRTDHKIRILTKYLSSSTTPWAYGDFVRRTGGAYDGYVALTSTGYSGLPHGMQVGDVIIVNQTDGGVQEPLLQGLQVVLEVVDDFTIVINRLMLIVGNSLMGGVATPIDGLHPTIIEDYRFEGTPYRAYPYLGHLDRPKDPRYDLNFGQIEGLYYPTNNITIANLFNTYYKRQMDELLDPNARLVTYNILLTPKDINEFRFNDNIFIKGSYYFVNKILDYSPNETLLTKVELIKANVSSVRLIQAPNNIGAGIRIIEEVPFEAYNDPNGSGLVGNGLVNGNGNQVGENNTILVVGDNNIAVGNNGIITGDNNRMFGDSVVVGDGNVVLGNNNLMIGSNGVLQGNNMLQVSGSFVVTANFVDAGSNIVLNEFPPSKANNLVSGGKNAVRPIGSPDIVNLLTGGRFLV